MSIKVHIHATHRRYTDGQEVVLVEGKTIGECLNHLIQKYPAMEKAIFSKKDKLHNIIEVYLNHTSAHPNELVRPVREGDEIHLIIMLAGG